MNYLNEASQHIEEEDEEQSDDKEVDATTSLADSSITCEGKEVMLMDTPTSTRTLMNSRYKQDKTEDKATIVEKDWVFQIVLKRTNLFQILKTQMQIRNYN